MPKTPQQIKDFIRHRQDELAEDVKSAGVRGDMARVNSLYGQMTGMEDVLNFILGDE